MAGLLFRLGTLRWLTLLAFNLVYVVVPALLYARTRSVELVGAAMIGEGLLRTLLSMGAGRWLTRLGLQRGMLVGAALRLGALAALAACLLWFSVIAVAAASTVFYIGHFMATLEQELRAARQGAQMVAAQTAYRVGEVLAPPMAFALALGAGRTTVDELAWLLAAAVLVVLAHAALFLRWWRGEPVPPPARGAGQAPGLAAAARWLLRDGPLGTGLLACIVGFGLYGWAVLATPFALSGRVLFGLALDSAAGIALFKAVAALIGVAGAIGWGRLLRRDGGARWVVAGTVASPLLFAAALTTRHDVLAVALLAAVCTLLLGLFSWQRRLRQLRSPPALYPGVTTLGLSLECLGVSLAGAALMSSAPWLLGALCSGLLLALLWRRPPRAAAGAPGVGQPPSVRSG